LDANNDDVEEDADKGDYGVPVLLHARRLKLLITMQNTLAGMKPNCAVLTAMTQTMALLMLARIQPSQQRLPIRMVDTTVRTQDK